jgi:hypothetical protein
MVPIASYFLPADKIVPCVVRLFVCNTLVTGGTESLAGLIARTCGPSGSVTAGSRSAGGAANGLIVTVRSVLVMRGRLWRLFERLSVCRRRVGSGRRESTPPQLRVPVVWSTEAGSSWSRLASRLRRLVPAGLRRPGQGGAPHARNDLDRRGAVWWPLVRDRVRPCDWPASWDARSTRRVARREAGLLGILKGGR